MTRRFFQLLIVLTALIGCLSGFHFTQPALARGLTSDLMNQRITPVLAEALRNPVDEKLGEVGTKIDLNNSNILAFTKYPGLYPTLARKVIENSPFNKVEDVLDMPDLSPRERDILEANLEHFVVTPPIPALNEGDDRINPGVYK
jgi:photosystem II PsbU protein